MEVQNNQDTNCPCPEEMGEVEKKVLELIRLHAPTRDIIRVVAAGTDEALSLASDDTTPTEMTENDIKFLKRTLLRVPLNVEGALQTDMRLYDLLQIMGRSINEVVIHTNKAIDYCDSTYKAEEDRKIAEGSDDPESPYYEAGRCANERERCINEGRREENDRLRQTALKYIVIPNDDEDKTVVEGWDFQGGHVEAIINPATEELAGVMSAADKKVVNWVKNNKEKLDETIDGSSIVVNPDSQKVEVRYNYTEGAGEAVTIPHATGEKAGVMTAADKAKLDALEEAVELPTTSGTSFVQSKFYAIGGKLVTDIAYYTESIIQPGSGIVKRYCMAAYMGGKYYKYYEGRTTSGKTTFNYSDTFTEANVPSDIASLFRATDTQSGLMSSSDKSSLDLVGSLFAEDMLLRTEGIVFSNVAVGDELEFTAHLKKGECFLIQTSTAGSISIDADGGYFSDDQTIDADGGSENTSPAEHSEYCLFQLGFTPLTRGETTNLTIKIVKHNK